MDMHSGNGKPDKPEVAPLENLGEQSRADKGLCLAKMQKNSFPCPRRR